MAKILLVEDEPDNRALIKMTLELTGHEVMEADSGELGIQQAHRVHPDLVLMDVSLAGGCDGLEATRRLRADESFNRTPIIALTGHTTHDVRERVIKAGCDEYVSKPIMDLRAFVDMVTRLAATGRGRATIKANAVDQT